MNLNSRLFLFFILFIFLASGTLAAPRAPRLPLIKGLTWVYEGRVEWLHDRTVQKKQIRLETRIIDVFVYRQTHIAIVSGFPTELAWYEDSPHPSYSLLIMTPTNIYQLSADDKAAAYVLARKFLLKKPKIQLNNEDSIFTEPLLKCNIPKLIKGLDPRRKAKCEQSEHRTNPDIEIIDFADGLGITRYYYNHFGTTSMAEVELKEIRFPKKRVIK